MKKVLFVIVMLGFVLGISSPAQANTGIMSAAEFYSYNYSGDASYDNSGNTRNFIEDDCNCTSNIIINTTDSGHDVKWIKYTAGTYYATVWIYYTHNPDTNAWRAYFGVITGRDGDSSCMPGAYSC